MRIVNQELQKLELSIKEGLRRKKKSDKLTEKKFRRNGHSFGLSVGSHNSMEIRLRRQGKKVNYQSQFRYIENILKGESENRKETKTPKSSLSRNTGTRDFCIDIPKDILTEVLSRLPVKTLVRFKCVSKSWQHLISNDVLVISSPKILIFSYIRRNIFDLTSVPNVKIFSIDNEARVESMCSPIEEYLLWNQTIKAHSSCHGLLLIQIGYDLYVRNPLTNFFRKVFTIGGFVDWENIGFLEIGLCYCSVNDKYKIMLVLHSRINSSRTQDIYVATCGSRKWEKIEAFDLDDMRVGPFFNGYRHWSNVYTSTQKFIAYFDPSMDKFIEVATPKPKEGEELIFLTLGVFDGCLSMNRWVKLENDGENIGLLLMKEYGNANSWEVVLVLSLKSHVHSYGGMVPLLRTKKGGVLAGIYEQCNCCYSVNAYDVHGDFLRFITQFSTCNPLYGDSFKVRKVGFHQLI